MHVLLHRINLATTHEKNLKSEFTRTRGRARGVAEGFAAARAKNLTISALWFFSIEASRLLNISKYWSAAEGLATAHAEVISRVGLFCRISSLL